MLSSRSGMMSFPGAARRLLPLLLLLGAATVFSGCSSVSVSLTTVSRPEIRLDKSTRLAFLIPQEMSLERRLLQERLEVLLRARGYTFVPPADAEMAVQVIFPGRLPFRPPNLPDGAIIIPSLMPVRVVAFRVADIGQKKWTSVWEGTAWAYEHDWTTHDLEILVSVFEHLGTSYSGSVMIKADPANHPPAAKG